MIINIRRIVLSVAAAAGSIAATAGIIASTSVVAEAGRELNHCQATLPR